MAQLWWRLLGPRAIVSDGVMGVNLASGSNPLAKCSLELSCGPNCSTPRSLAWQSLRLRRRPYQCYAATAGRAAALSLSETKLSESS